jgi:DNA-binding NarL/FixJ family response regulator
MLFRSDCGRLDPFTLVPEKLKPTEVNMSKQGPVRILIVDHHDALRRAIRSLLESLREFEICGEAKDGVDAVKKSAELKPDVVVLNIVMPVMDGFEAARKIRAVSPQSRMVILSSHKDQELLEEAKSVGAVWYVPKSEAGGELIEAIKAAAGGESSALL